MNVRYIQHLHVCLHLHRAAESEHVHRRAQQRRESVVRNTVRVMNNTSYLDLLVSLYFTDK